jgi:2-oxoglutarate dehydrogenase E2 component (dihydrolipoamide succinyltransferase)
MAKFEVKLPKMGESVAEATIISWLKNVGDTVELDETLVEIATDKVDSEVPSEVEGTLLEIKFEADAVVKVGDTIAIIETAGEESNTELEVDEKVSNEEAEQIEEKVNETIEDNTIEKVSLSGKFYSPLVRNIAEKEGVSMDELEAIIGTGKDNRVTKNDILAYIESGREVSKQNVSKEEKNIVEKSTKTVKSEPKVSTPVSVNGTDEVIEMTRMGKLIAHHMVASVQTSAHVQSFIEVDVTNIVKWRNAVKDKFFAREGEKNYVHTYFYEGGSKSY